MRDFVDEVEIPADCLHGIHTARALANFPLARRPVHPALVAGYVACALLLGVVRLRSYFRFRARCRTLPPADHRTRNEPGWFLGCPR